MEDERYLKAKKKVENLKAFYIHLIVYVLVNTMFVVINVLTYKYAEHWWFFYPLMGWGIGLISHGLSVSSFGLFGANWEEKKIQEYMDKDKRNL
ncbi:2TM domain-containing protein [Oceanobacillus bengalensis]|uniref:2TM domain-containing protein n=1 Tax=Oceanobacillus bengalensis TaxID=1435466 RepID=UPI001FE7E9FF|nr:2TM domain-containing protein [Oceanobacillus bengalensis]